MATQQQGQQFDNPQRHEQRRGRLLGKRWLIAGIILLLVAAGTIIWIVTDQGSLTTILPIVIFTVLGVVIGLFQWLFPVSSSTSEHHSAILHPSLMGASSLAEAAQLAVHVPPVDHTHLPQSGPLDRPAYRS